MNQNDDIKEKERLLIDFFSKFTELEFTLKRNGFLRPNTDKVIVDWNRFADIIEPQFENTLQDEKLKEAVEYIEEYPPRKLVRKSKSNKSPICWSEVPAKECTRLKNILIYIRRIRNNLFHGEKPQILVGGTTRDSDLLEYGSIILKKLISLYNESQRCSEDRNNIYGC